jgi:hypothetical protein
MLPTAVARKPLHHRHVHYAGFEREDGLFDIEASLLDTKTEAFEIDGEGPRQAGEPIHGMHLRVVIDAQFVVQDIEVAMAQVPHGECLSAQAPMRRMVGCCMRQGWRQAISERLGKVQGCAHLRELLLNMGTVAIQTLSPRMGQARRQDGGVPLPMGGCLAWDPAGPMVARIYPQFHIDAPAPKAQT